jgi:hypothetical protein
MCQAYANKSLVSGELHPILPPFEKWYIDVTWTLSLPRGDFDSLWLPHII